MNRFNIAIENRMITYPPAPIKREFRNNGGILAKACLVSNSARPSRLKLKTSRA